MRLVPCGRSTWTALATADEAHRRGDGTWALQSASLFLGAALISTWWIKHISS